MYYNSFNGPTCYTGHFNDLDSLWEAYASIALSAKWNLLGNYESVKHNDTYKNINGDSSSAVWIGKLTYGTADMRTPKPWDAWVEYLNSDDGAAFGSSNSWRFGKMDNITSWGVGFDYTFAPNAQISLSQTFGTSLKDGADVDSEEQSLVQLAFAF